MRALNLTDWLQQYGECKGILEKKAIYTLYQIIEEASQKSAEYESKTKVQQAAISQKIEELGKPAQDLFDMRTIHSYLFIMLEMDKLARDAQEVKTYVAQKKHNDEPKVIEYLRYNTKLELLTQKYPDMAKHSQNIYAVAKEKNDFQGMMAGVEGALEELIASDKNLSELNSLLRESGRYNKEIAKEMFPKFCCALASLYVCVSQLDINFRAGIFKPIMARTQKENPETGAARRVLQRPEKFFDNCREHEVNGIRTAYRLAEKLVAQQFADAIYESTTFDEEGEAGLKRRPSTERQIKNLSVKLMPRETGMHG